jgi:hypothetical protein
MVQLLGFKFEKVNEEIPSPIPSVDEEGSIVIEKNWAPGTHDAYGVAANFDNKVSSETELITKYREMAELPEVDYAIDDIINEIMSIEKPNDIVSINLDDLDYTKSIKTKITDEFNHILSILDFNNSAYEIAKNWYVDGRLNFEIIIDGETYKQIGIKELRYIDPRTIRKIKEVKNSEGRAHAIMKTVTDEYFIYSPTGFDRKAFNTGSFQTNDVIKMAADSVVHITSGQMNHNKTMVHSFLHKAIRPLNQLRALEDAAVVYRISRAPERRIFYIDVGNLPKAKAEQHLQNVATKYKNKLVYDQKSGDIRDDRKFMTMTEDYFLPRRSDGKATEITTLPGGQNLGELDEVQYFLSKFYRSLNIPVSRLENQTGFSFGRQSEISRDEVKFAKFVGRLRKRFSQLFIKLLKTQLVLKNVISLEEFNEIKNDITFEYSADNIFAENKEQELIASRLDLLGNIDNYKGVYYSKEYIQRKILRMTQEDIDENEKQIEKEKNSNEYEEDNDMIANNSNYLGYKQQERDELEEEPPKPAVKPNNITKKEEATEKEEPEDKPKKVAPKIKKTNDESDKDKKL